jgi:lincosamide nucleotidyltransferase A/C/D/E
MGIVTREARPTDVEALLGLDEMARTDPGRARFIRGAVASGGCIVAEHGGSVVGYGVLEDSFFGQGFVSMLYVAASQRRHGVGGALLRALVRRCTTPKLFTSTNASNVPMQGLLARFGFEPSGIIHNLDPGDPELVYVRVLEADGAHMPADAAAALLDLLEDEGIAVWVDGGWAVDAVLGEQTREHADLDVVVETAALPRLRALLDARGFAEVPRADTRPWNFVLGDANGRQLDVHAITVDGNGDGVYGPAERGEVYPAEALTGEGVIAGRRVRCIAPAWLVRFRTGYEPRAVDRLDVAALCARFGIAVPEAFVPTEAPMGIRYERDAPLSNRDLGDLLQPDLPEAERRDHVAVLERSLLWVCAYEGERLVGFCHLAWDGGVHAFLLDPTVREGYRRRGIGTVLVREALAAAAAHPGIEWVHVDASAALMERFYGPAGFRPTPAGLVWLDDVRAGRVT